MLARFPPPAFSLSLAVVLTFGCGDSPTKPTPTCTYSVSPTVAALAAAGGSGTVTVATQASCPWTATSTLAWLEITGGATGSGPGQVTFVAQANPAPDPRAGTLTVAGQTVRVDQAPDLQQCQYTVAPVSFDVCMAAPAGVVAVIDTTSACPWTASAGTSWLTVTTGAAGVGPGTIRVAVADNYDQPRAGVVLVRWPTPTEGQNLQVAQAGCSYGVSPEEVAFAAAGGVGSFDVVQQSDPILCGGPLQNQCVWSAASGDAWITVTSSMPRQGDDRVSFTVAANSGGARAGTIVVRDRTVRIVQEGAPSQAMRLR